MDFVDGNTALVEAIEAEIIYLALYIEQSALQHFHIILQDAGTDEDLKRQTAEKNKLLAWPLRNAVNREPFFQPGSHPELFLKRSCDKTLTCES